MLELARGVQRPKLVDVGTGSGCIALALAHELPDAEVYAVDLSVEALEIARANAARLQLDKRVCFLRTDVLDVIPTEARRGRPSGGTCFSEFRDFDFVVSNPPYVAFSEADKVQRSVQEFEPRMAVFAGPHGTDVIVPLIEQARRALKPGGWLALEIGYSMRDEVVNLLSPTMWDDIRVVPDLQGIPRVVMARRR